MQVVALLGRCKHCDTRALMEYHNRVCWLQYILVPSLLSVVVYTPASNVLSIGEGRRLCVSCICLKLSCFLRCLSTARLSDKGRLDVWHALNFFVGEQRASLRHPHRLDLVDAVGHHARCASFWPRHHHGLG